MFRPEDVRAFHFEGFDYDEAEALLTLRYRMDAGPHFVETLRFVAARTDLDAAERRALTRCFEALHLVCGISYYKAAIPPQVELAGGGLAPGLASFLDVLYTRGLDEFAFTNDVDLSGRVHFPRDPTRALAAGEVHAPRLPRRTAVPLGGGKDSIVVAELLADRGESITTLSIGASPVAARVAEVLARRHPGRITHHGVERQVSPELFRLNREGALNGHIPISAVFAFVFAAGAILYGYDAVAVGNERSADVGSVVAPDREVNHQISKSLEFEDAMAALIGAELVPGLEYFSLLRPLSELRIASVFGAMTDYHPVFVSCNRAFRISGGATRGWCGDCPKCRFVFLILSPFIAREALLEIFGKDLLDDAAQLEGYRALLGLGAPKPFECVGEIEESRAALSLIADREEWTGRAIVRATRSVLPGTEERARLVARAMALSPDHRLPERFRGVVGADP